MARARSSRALARAVLVALVAAGGAPVDATCAAGTWAKSVFYNYDESFDGVCVACIDDENYVLARATCPGGFNNFMCPPGYNNYYEPPSCVMCMLGTYKNTLSADACSRCDKGYYMPNPGATVCCIPCLRSEYFCVLNQTMRIARRGCPAWPRTSGCGEARVPCVAAHTRLRRGARALRGRAHPTAAPASCNLGFKLLKARLWHILRCINTHSTQQARQLPRSWSYVPDRPYMRRSLVLA